jgi:hypothetical protein
MQPDAEADVTGEGGPEEFVVALPYVDRVVDRLRRIRGLTYNIDRCPELGLALVTLHGLAGAAEKLRINGGQTRDEAPDHPRILEVLRPLKEDATELDRLMFQLRFCFAADHGLWMPPLAKNRRMNVTGVPHVDGGPPHPVIGGATLYPESVKRDEVPPDSAPERGRGVRVGVIDTELWPHDALAGHYICRPPRPSRDFEFQWDGHAAFVAGLIKRAAPAAELDIRPVLDGYARTTVWQLAKKMVEFRNSGVQILCLALGIATDDGEIPKVLAHAVDALTPDIVIVGAAGNHGDPDENQFWPHLTPQSAFWPAASEKVVAVGAHDEHNFPAKFSPNLDWITYTAPGVNVVSTYLTGKVTVRRIDSKTGVFGPGVPEAFPWGYARWSGTSFSAATFAGELAARSRPGLGGAHDGLAALREDAKHNAAGGVLLYRP